MGVDRRYSGFDTVQIEVRRRCYPMTVFLRLEACVDQEVLPARFEILELWALIGVANGNAESFWGETREWSPRAERKGSRVHEIR